MLDEYVIPFYGLKEGVHEYNFVVNNMFFEFFNNPDLTGGDLNVLVSLNKKSTFFEMGFKIKGSLRLICDRCLDEFNYPVDIQKMLYVSFGEENEEQTDNMVIISREETRLNVAQFIYELSALNVPIKKIHPNNEKGESTCNKGMLEKLKQHQGEKKNEIDPRWEALKKLKN